MDDEFKEWLESQKEDPEPKGPVRRKRAIPPEPHIINLAIVYDSSYYNNARIFAERTTGSADNWATVANEWHTSVLHYWCGVYLLKVC